MWQSGLYSWIWKFCFQFWAKFRRIYHPAMRRFHLDQCWSCLSQELLSNVKTLVLSVIIAHFSGRLEFIFVFLKEWKNWKCLWHQNRQQIGVLVTSAKDIASLLVIITCSVALLEPCQNIFDGAFCENSLAVNHFGKKAPSSIGLPVCKRIHCTKNEVLYEGFLL